MLRTLSVGDFIDRLLVCSKTFSSGLRSNASKTYIVFHTITTANFHVAALALGQISDEDLNWKKAM